jgi:tetratricopeptide (TPR) repeat protein
MSAQKTVRLWHRRYLVLGAAAWLLSTIPANLATAAPKDDAVAQVVRLNKEARTFFDAMEFDMAEKNLKKAIEVGEAAALGDHVVLVGSYGNLGVLYATGLKNEAEAVALFKKALELRPDYQPSKELSSPEVKELFQRAKADLEASPPSAVPETEPAAGDDASGQFSCPVADTATTGTPLKLRCVAEAGLGVKDAIVYYHAGTNSKFRSLKMNAESSMDGTPSWTAALAPDALNDEQLFIYFEARDKKAKVVASVSSASNPIVVGIRAAQPSLSAGDDEGSKASSAEGGTLWFGMGIGTGYGYAASDPESYKPYIPDFQHGAAPAKLFHLTPEVGYFLSPNWSLSLQGRFQMMQQWSTKTARGAVAFLGRLLYFTGGETFRFYGGAVLGGGEGFRLVIENVQTKDYKTSKVTTTVKGGPVIAGGTVGLAVNLSDSWSWILESNALVGFPTVSMVADFNTGLRFSL